MVDSTQSTPPPPKSSSYSSSIRTAASIPSKTTLRGSHKLLTTLSDHAGPVSSLAVCGEFLLSASHEIIVYQNPNLQLFTKFNYTGYDNGSIKSLIAIGNRVFTAHQDSRIRVWKLSSSPENPFKLVATLPTKRDCFVKCLRQSNYVQTRRHHKKLWVEHADSISCLAVSDGLIYSGSWDKTLKVWRKSDLKCLESIRAHDDAISALVSSKGLIYSASADGKIKVWEKIQNSYCLKECLESRGEVCWNAIIVCEEGRYLYGGGSDGRIVGWEGDGDQSWKMVCGFKAHEKAVLSLCWRGSFVCSGSGDMSIRIWRREKGELFRHGVLLGHEGPVKCLQALDAGVGFGFVLYSGGLDHSLRVWWVSEEYKELDKEHV